MKSEENNLEVWNHASKTLESATKTTELSGRKTTSINGYWMVKKATELWGPLGSGWGYEIIDEEFRDGIPIMHDGNPICMTQVHTIKIRLWYDGDQNKGFMSYGHTPYVLGTRHGPMCDPEAPKKSLTDAIKKALSYLGFSYDVFSGQFEDQSYVASLKIEEDINQAEEKDVEIINKKKDLAEYITNHIRFIEDSGAAHEANLIEKTCVKHLSRMAAIPELKGMSEKGIKSVSLAAATRKEELKNEK